VAKCTIFRMIAAMTSQPLGVIPKLLKHPLLYAALIIAAAAIEGCSPTGGTGALATAPVSSPTPSP
jgi:hypothetical protein